jgi:hypothetical protein
MALRRLAIAVVLGACALAGRAAADPVEIRAAAHDGFGRIAFDWPEPVEYSAHVADNTLTVHFSRPIEAQAGAIKSALGAYVADARIAAQGKDLVAHLTRPVTATAFVVHDRTVVVDLAPAVVHKAAPAKPAPQAKPVAKEEPAAPAKPAAEEKPAAPNVRIVAKEKGHIAQVTFVWPRAVKAEFSEKDGAARLTVHAAGTIDPAALAKALPALSPAIQQQRDATILSMTVPAGVHLLHFQHGKAITLEVKGTPAAAVPPAPPAAAPPPPAVAAAAPQEPQPPAPEAAAEPTPASAPPAPPPASVAVRFIADNGPSLVFDWPSATGIAVFRRGGAVWVVFGTPTTLDLADPQAHGQPAFDALAQIATKNATVLRVVPRDGREPSLRRSGTTWMVDFKIQAAPSDAPIPIDIVASASSGSAAAAFHVHGAGAPVRLNDPDHGDTLLVVPVSEVGRGIASPPFLVDFAALASLQGIALHPFVDDLDVTVADDAVTVTRPGGLLVSNDRDRLLGRKPARANMLFDFAGWRGSYGDDYTAGRNALERAVADAPQGARSQPRLALARFYFSNLFAEETLAVLDALGHDDPAMANEPAVRALKGAACLLTGDRKCAATELGQKSLDGEVEAELWRASLAVKTADWDGAAQGFLASVSLLPTYPVKLRTRFALEAAQTMLETGRTNLVDPLLELVPNDLSDRSAQAMLLYLQGRKAQHEGRLDEALALWDKAAALQDPPSRARALYDRALALFDAGRANRTDTIKALDALRFVWRGDAFEFALLRKLGELKLAENDAGGGLEALQQAAVYFPDYPAAKDVAKNSADIFAGLFLGPQSDDLPPLKALVLYDRFHELEPVGERRDRIVARLIDRLVAVDLLDRAAALLDEQVKTRLAGADKARGATQLALLRLMDHKPDAALQALDIDVGQNLPDELARQRQQLRARTLLELGKGKDALSLLSGDQSRDADRLRADIYWRGHDWKEAANTLFRLAGPAPTGKLDPESVRVVVGLAAALTLSDDQAGLARLRSAFGPAMRESSAAATFDVLAGGNDAPTGDVATLAGKVAQIGELQSFVASYRQKLASAKVGTTN